MMPGKRISTGCYDMPSAVLWAEEFLKNRGIQPGAVPTLSELAKDFFVKDGKGSYRERMQALGYEYPDSYYKSKQSTLDNHILPAFGSYIVTAITTISVEDYIISARSTACLAPP